VEKSISWTSLQDPLDMEAKIILKADRPSSKAYMKDVATSSQEEEYDYS